MIVLVPKAFAESGYGSEKHALKIMSRLVCDNIQNCADFKSDCAKKAKKKGRYCERVAKMKPTNPKSLLGSWIYLGSKELKKIASGYSETLKDLERDGWIKKNPHYSNFPGNEFCHSFQIQSNWWSEPITLHNIKHRLIKKKYRCVVGDAGGDLNREYLAAENFLEFFTLPEDKVEELDALCELSSWPDYQRYCIAMMSQRKWWSSVDDYGRYHSPFTNLSKNIRKYLSCNGQGVVGFDFANFQPALLTRQTITKIPDNEYKKYYSLCSRGEIYEHMAEECPRYKSRDEAKTDFLAMLNKKNQFMIQMELFKTFQMSFPRYADTVLKIKEDSHLEMTKFLQWHETQIMFGGIVRDFMTKSKSPFFTIHDSIYSANTEKQILKNVITPEDWDSMSEHIQYDFLYDNHFSELKEAELLNERLTLAQAADPYIGKYYSQDYVRRKILRQTDMEIIEQDKLIEKEIKEGKIPDPATIDPATGQPYESAAGMDLGAPVMEPEADGSATEAPELPKGGEI